MNEVSNFLIGVGITLTVSMVVVVYLQKHLRRILIDLCQTEDRADFWTAFTNVTVVLVPVICAMFHRPGAYGGGPGFFDVTTQLQWALMGLIGSVVGLGAVVASFIPTEITSKLEK